jgi:hypothetical protein
MQRWEYHVIRLNIEPPTPAASEAAPPSSAPDSGAGPAAPAPPRSGPVFSQEYLKQEFPGFYGPEPATPPQPAAPEDPGQQLGAFLNGQGQQGWELVGLQHAGPHTFIIFKRPAAADLEAANVQAQQLNLTLEMANRALSILEKQAP